MADSKISTLTALPSSGFATDDLFVIVDTSAVETKSTTIADLDARFASSGHTHTSSDVTDFNEAAQDAVGGILTDSSRIDFTYDDVGNTITADLIAGSVSDTYVATGINATKIGGGTVDNTEFSYLNGVTSAIQTQIDGKEASITTLAVSKGGTNSGTALNNNRVMQSSAGAIVEAAAITASRALASDANGIPVASTTTATELGFVNGVTGAIQTQLDAKQTTTLADGKILVGNASNVAAAVTMSGDATISNAGAVTIGAQKVDVSKMTSAANSFAANNTASTAAPTAQTFIRKDAATYSSTITWTGGTAPSGSTTNEYGFQQVGNVVTYWIILKYTVAGATLTAVAMEFPSDFPAMREPAGQTAASDKLWATVGFMDSASTGSPGVGRSWIRRNSGDTAYEVVVQTGSGSISALMVWAQGSYFTS